MMEAITEYIQRIFHVREYVKKDVINQYEQVINGSYTITNTLINNRLCINGQAILSDGVVAEKNITVNGKLSSTKATFQSDLIVNGNASLQNTTVVGMAQFRESLDAKESVCLIQSNYYRISLPLIVAKYRISS